LLALVVLVILGLIAGFIMGGRRKTTPPGQEQPAALESAGASPAPQPG
jgi:hypothetical protein